MVCQANEIDPAKIRFTRRHLLKKEKRRDGRVESVQKAGKYLLFPGRVQSVQEAGKYLLFPGRVESVPNAGKIPSFPR